VEFYCTSITVKIKGRIRVKEVHFTFDPLCVTVSSIRVLNFFVLMKDSDLVQSVDNEWPFNGNYTSQCIIKTPIPAAESNFWNICLCLQTLSRSSCSSCGLWLQIQRKLLQFLPFSSPITGLQEKHTGLFHGHHVNSFKRSAEAPGTFQRQDKLLSVLSCFVVASGVP